VTRLASIAKAGFYPTPERVQEWVANYLSVSEQGGRLLDPCCGEGIAAQYLGKEWQLETYGIEIDSERAVASTQRLHRVLNVDYSAVRIPQNAFQVLFLNPPYSPEEGEAKRIEYRFLRDTGKWLQPRGILIYIIPQYRLDARMARHLATYYRELAAYRFPDPEYDDFSQMVVFGVARQEAMFDESCAIPLLQACRGQLPVLQQEVAVRYEIPPPLEIKFYFRGNAINPEEALTEAMKVGVWHSAEWQQWLEPANDLAALQPLMPLKKGHLAMLIAAGLLQNLVLERDDERLLIKGRTYKVTDEVESDDENEEVARDRFVTEIVTIDLNNGERTKLDAPAALAEFIEKWQDLIAQRVIETFAPLYRFDLEAYGERVNAILNRLSKNRRLPGRQETGLFSAQKHVATALWKRLTEANFAILVGEMGVGKTTIGSAVAALLQAKGSPTLILCPPHLVNKWIREVKDIVPMAFAMALYCLSDVERFVREIKHLAPGTPTFAVLSREMAKLGSGWKPAFITRRRVLALNEERRQFVLSVDISFIMWKPIRRLRLC
jgi:16S rRNA G966 N2-methylase RsmD